MRKEPIRARLGDGLLILIYYRRNCSCAIRNFTLIASVLSFFISNKMYAPMKLNRNILYYLSRHVHFYIFAYFHTQVQKFVKFISVSNKRKEEEEVPE